MYRLCGDNIDKTVKQRYIRSDKTGTKIFIGEHLTMYRLCGDNIDKTVKQRYIRSDKTGTESIHHFHSYAVSDRIDFSDMSEILPATGVTDPQQLALSLLPSPEDDAAMRNNISILISRVLVNNLDFSKLSFDKVVDWHIKHDFYQQMSTKSDVVCTNPPPPPPPPPTHTHTHTHTHIPTPTSGFMHDRDPLIITSSSH